MRGAASSFAGLGSSWGRGGRGQAPLSLSLWSFPLREVKSFPGLSGAILSVAAQACITLLIKAAEGFRVMNCTGGEQSPTRGRERGSRPSATFPLTLIAPISIHSVYFRGPWGPIPDVWDKEEVKAKRHAAVDASNNSSVFGGTAKMPRSYVDLLFCFFFMPGQVLIIT